MLANTDNFSVDRVLDKFNLRNKFEHIFLSYQEGVIKTDPRMYEILLKRLKVTPQQCMAVGDSMESDIAAAQNADVKAILIDRRNAREFEPKITSLRELEWS